MSTCPRCGAVFSCAMADQTGHPCWCTALPAAVPVPQEAAACWCRACLEQLIATLAGPQATITPATTPAADDAEARQWRERKRPR